MSLSLPITPTYLVVMVVGLSCIGIYIGKIVTISQLSCPALIILFCPRNKNRVILLAIIKMFIEQNSCTYLPSIFSYLIPIKCPFQFDKYPDSCQFAFGNQCCFKWWILKFRMKTKPSGHSSTAVSRIDHWSNIHLAIWPDRILDWIKTCCRWRYSWLEADISRRIPFH